MTVAIGLQGTGGIVFCSDRQITREGGLKYEQVKISIAHHFEVPLSCASVYSDNPDVARNLYKEIWDNAPRVYEEARKAGRSSQESIRLLIEEVFQDKRARNTEMLLAFSTRNQGNFTPCFWRASGPNVITGIREFIGAGDSSVLRHIAQLIERAHPSIKGLIIAAMYMVTLANRYIDRCSGGPDVMAMYPDGRAEILSKEQIEPYKSKMADIDLRLAEALLAVMP